MDSCDYGIAWWGHIVYYTDYNCNIYSWYIFPTKIRRSDSHLLQLRTLCYFTSCIILSCNAHTPFETDRGQGG